MGRRETAWKQNGDGNFTVQSSSRAWSDSAGPLAATVAMAGAGCARSDAAPAWAAAGEKECRRRYHVGRLNERNRASADSNLRKMPELAPCVRRARLTKERQRFAQSGEFPGALLQASRWASAVKNRAWLRREQLAKLVFREMKHQEECSQRRSLRCNLRSHRFSSLLNCTVTFADGVERSVEVALDCTQGRPVTWRSRECPSLRESAEGRCCAAARRGAQPSPTPSRLAAARLAGFLAEPARLGTLDATSRPSTALAETCFQKRKRRYGLVSGRLSACG